MRVEPLRQGRRVAHDLGGHRERRAGRETDLHEGAVAALVVRTDEALAVGEDHVGVLHGALRGQAAVLLASDMDPRVSRAHPEALDDVDLHVDAVLEPVREEVVVVGGGGAAAQQQLGERGGRRELEVAGVSPAQTPYRPFSQGTARR
jgi:hypothetical protein